MPEFQSLASLLIPQTITAAGEPFAIPPPAQQSELRDEPDAEDAPLAGEARRFYAHVREELERCVQNLLERIARDVLARELQCEPVATRELVARAYREWAASEPLRVRVHPDDAAGCKNGPLPVFEDAAVARGGAMLELRTGVVDVRLETRLQTVLDAEPAA